MARTTLVPAARTRTVTKTIDPVTRIEGHLRVKIEVSAGKVANAWSSGLLWRGFEHILLGRDPRDAPILTQRICGVCHAVHRLTSILALEDASTASGAQLTPTPDAVRIRNIEQGINFVYSHAAHIFVLAGPDYDLYGLVPGLSEGKSLDQYYSVLKSVVLPAQRLCHEIAAIFGGKTPHHMTTLPGGVTCVPTQNAITAALNRMSTIKGTINTYAPKVLEFLEAHRSELEAFGAGCGNFLAYGVFADPDRPKDPSRLLLKRGISINGGATQPLDVTRITEAVKYSWYTSTSGGNPAQEIPPKDFYGKRSAYSWLKAPRYNAKVFEVGPLARLAVSGRYPRKASVYDRLKARASEMLLVMENVEAWIRELSPGARVYEPYNVPYGAPYTSPTSATGVGLWEAPRGANGHWVRIEGGKIAHYQVVAPTNWNASPRDDDGQLGPIEQALINVPVPDPEKPINALRTVRSFDPCLACSVHVIIPDERDHIGKLGHPERSPG